MESFVRWRAIKLSQPRGQIYGASQNTQRETNTPSCFCETTSFATPYVDALATIRGTVIIGRYWQFRGRIAGAANQLQGQIGKYHFSVGKWIFARVLEVFWKCQPTFTYFGLK